MSTETFADWCKDLGDGVVICGTDMEEASRRPLGIRWCFHCRKRHEFWWVVMTPVGLSYYGPHVDVRGVKHGCRDLFPGWEREWDE